MVTVPLEDDPVAIVTLVVTAKFGSSLVRLIVSAERAAAALPNESRSPTLAVMLVLLGTEIGCPEQVAPPLGEQLMNAMVDGVAAPTLIAPDTPVRDPSVAVRVRPVSALTSVTE